MRLLFLSFFFVLTAQAQTTRYVSTAGTNVGGCTSDAAPCLTPEYGVSQLASGDTLKIHAGTYKLTTKLLPPAGTASKRTTVMGFPGEARPVLDGRNLEYGPGEISWSQVGTTNVWYATWLPAWTVEVLQSSARGRITTGEEEHYRETITVNADSRPYLYYNTCTAGYTGTPSSMPAGRICVIDDDPYHGSPSLLYIHLRDSSDPNLATIRMSTLGCIFNCNNSNEHTALRSYLHIEGLHLKYAAGTNGIIVLGPGSGGGHYIIDNVVEYSNTDGITGGGNVGSYIAYNISRWNGKGNFTSSNMSNSTWEYNQSGTNNHKGFRCGHSCGNKFTDGTGNVFRYNFAGNPGLFDVNAESGSAVGDAEMGNEFQADGFWFDVHFSQNQIYGNHADSTWRTCIFNEISEQNYIFGNLCTRIQSYGDSNNRHAIEVAGSKESIMAYNTVINSDGCFHGRSYARTSSSHGDWPFDNIVSENLWINNLCWTNERAGEAQINIERVPDDTGMNDALLASNRFDGNGYHAITPGNTYFRYKPAGTEQTYTLSNIAGWRTARGFDNSSFTITHNQLVDTQVIGKAIAIPDTSWWNISTVLTDFAGVTRPASGGAIGALHYTAGDLYDVWYMFTTAENQTAANWAAKAWDPDTGGQSTFSVIRLSPTGAGSPTYYGAATVVVDFMRPMILSAERRGLIELYKGSAGWTFATAIADLGLQRIP